MSERKFASTLIRDSEDKLGLTPEQVSQLLADANTTVAKTKGFTQIGDVNFEDGLIFTSLMKLLDAGNEGQEMAGISGIAGDDKDNPAFWAGGTYEQAMAFIAYLKAMENNTPSGTGAGQFNYAGEYPLLAPITMMHDGSGKQGDFIIERSGRIVMVDPATGKPRLVFSSQNIPILGDLLSTTNFGNSTTATGMDISIPSSGSSTSYLSGILNVSKNASTISITGGAPISLSGQLDNGVSVGLNLYLTKDGVKYQSLELLQILGGSDSVVSTVKSITIKGVPSGNYRLMLEVIKLGAGGASGSGNVGNIPMSWSFQQSGIRNFLFGLNGFLSYFSDRHIYFSEEDGFDLRGKTNMPGVLASGTVAANGGQANTWGAKASADGTSTVTGGRRVPLLNLEHNEYTVQITPHTSTTPFRVGAKTTTGFEALGTGAFDYTVIGRNY